jgi:hypothetical protein
VLDQHLLKLLILYSLFKTFAKDVLCQKLRKKKSPLIIEPNIDLTHAEMSRSSVFSKKTLKEQIRIVIEVQNLFLTT